jgi:hypothetical protein
MPPNGGMFPNGNPTAPQVQQALKDVLLDKRPYSVQKPYQMIMDEVKDAWGPDHLPGLTTIFSAPNVSIEIAVELTWADGKNWVGNPQNQHQKRTFSTVIDLLLNRWYYGDGAEGKRNHGAGQFSHCNNEIQKAVNKDHKEDDGPMKGKFPHFQGLPDEPTLKEWRILAGLINGDEEVEDEMDVYDEDALDIEITD